MIVWCGVICLVLTHVGLIMARLMVSRSDLPEGLYPALVIMYLLLEKRASLYHG